MSPSLFVMGTEVLSRLLSKAIITREITYHPLSSNLELTRLGIVDDILIFLKGERSLNSVLNIFDKFYKMSGLKLNLKKRQIYSVGIDDAIVSEMLRRIGLKQGKLLVRYLGVPLIPERLTNRDRQPLIERITSRI